MMCCSASSRALRSVSAMMRSRVSGHSAIGSVRLAALRFSRNWRLPSSRRLRSAVGPGRDAPLGHACKERDVLGQGQGMVEGGDEDVGAQHDLRRARGKSRQYGQGGRPVVIGDGVMLLHPHGVETERFGPGDLLQRLPVVVTALDGDEADLQSGHERCLLGDDARGIVLRPPPPPSYSWITRLLGAPRTMGLTWLHGRGQTDAMARYAARG